MPRAVITAKYAIDVASIVADTARPNAAASRSLE
jgi:hypothetical protein